MLGDPTGKLVKQEPETFIGTSHLPHKEIAGNIYNGKFGEDAMLAAPDITDEALQRRMMRRAKMVISVIIVLVIVFSVLVFFVFGLVVSKTSGTMCGAYGQLRSPQCDRVSWEFCCGAASLAFVVVMAVSQGVFVMCVLPAGARKRRRLREERAQLMQAGEEP